MIYLFHGTDSAKVRAKAFQWVAAAKEKRPDASYVRLSTEAITEEALMEITASQGLFFSKMLVLLDDPFATADSAELVLEHLDILAASENPIALVAPKLLAARVKKVEAKAEKVFVNDLKEKKEVRGFNGALVNALAARNGSLLWTELQKAERLGDAPEALHGLLHWKARDLMEKGSPKWNKQDARKLSRDLISLLSDARGGELPLKESLERFALSLR